ncbi:MAG: hypothetical protein WA364_08765 [Candidatus Nitrosopolaris sp.]
MEASRSSIPHDAHLVFCQNNSYAYYCIIKYDIDTLYVLIEAIGFEVILKVGIILPQAGQQATRDNVIQTAQQAEKEGFDSLWVFERLLWPTHKRYRK